MKYKVKISNFTFGVPITFVIDHYNPQYFKILGTEWQSIDGGRLAGLVVNNSIVWKRVLIRFK